MTNRDAQYELDGASETHDPSLPSTNTCPYLPGQTVNTLWVPVEQSNRKRSASLNSLRDDDYKTMSPADKFTTPRPAPTPPDTFRRIGTAPQLLLQHKRSARSLSPGSGWSFSPRKLFSRKPSCSSLLTDTDLAPWEEERSVRSSEGSRSRDISPESLRRFLSDDTILVEEPDETDRPVIAIPEDIVEEVEDDDNFATSAVSESIPFTGLSPPPTQRSASPSIPSTVVSLEAHLPPSEPERPAPPTRAPPQVPQLNVIAAPAPVSRFSFSDASFYSQNSPQSPDSNSLPSFYHSEDEEDEFPPTNDDAAVLPGIESADGARCSFVRDLDAALSTYSLPRSAPEEGKLTVVTQAPVGSPALVARDGTDVPVGNTSLLTSPIPNSGLEELVNELGWMADVIRSKDA